MDTIFRYNVLFYEYVVYGVFERLRGFVIGLFKNVKISRSVALGFTISKLTDWIYDLFVFTVVLVKFGWIGVPFLTIGAGILCWITILMYDRTKVDFLGIESAKKEMTVFKEKISVWIEGLDRRPGQKLHVPLFEVQVKYDTDSVKLALSKIWIVEFFICTFHWDAVVTTIYLREKSFGGLTRRDWKIFWTSIVISCVYWSAVVLTGIAVYECSKEFVAVILLIIWNK
jgi:hypothetical protein